MKKLLQTTLLAGLIASCAPKTQPLSQEQREIFQDLKLYEQAKVAVQLNEEPVTILPGNHMKQLFLLADNNVAYDSYNYLGNAIKNFMQPFLQDSIGVHAPGYLDLPDLVGSITYLDTKKEKRKHRKERNTKSLNNEDVYIVYLYESRAQGESILKYEFLKGDSLPIAGVFTLGYQANANTPPYVVSAGYVQDTITTNHPLRDTTAFIKNSNSLYQIIKSLYE